MRSRSIAGTPKDDKFRSSVFVSSRLARKDELSPSGRAFDVQIIASTSRVARDGGLIEVGAWKQDLNLFRSNPVIQWAHDYSLPPIAISPDVMIDESTGNLMQWWRFLTGISDDEWDRFAGRCKALYQVGGMRAASVGWHTRQYREPSMEEVQQSILNGDHDLRWVVVRGELLETSAVPVPADPYALTVDRAIKEARKKGVDMGDLERAWVHLKTHSVESDELTKAGKAGSDWKDRVKDVLKDDLRVQIAVAEELKRTEEEVVAEAVAEAATETETVVEAVDASEQHATSYTCQACGHTQDTGGVCAECGSDQMKQKGEAAASVDEQHADALEGVAEQVAAQAEDAAAKMNCTECGHVQDASEGTTCTVCGNNEMWDIEAGDDAVDGLDGKDSTPLSGKSASVEELSALLESLGVESDPEMHAAFDEALRKYEADVQTEESRTADGTVDRELDDFLAELEAGVEEDSPSRDDLADFSMDELRVIYREEIAAELKARETQE